MGVQRCARERHSLHNFLSMNFFSSGGCIFGILGYSRGLLPWRRRRFVVGVLRQGSRGAEFRW